MGNGRSAWSSRCVASVLARREYLQRCRPSPDIPRPIRFGGHTERRGERRLRLAAQRDPALTQRAGLHDVTPCHRRRPLGSAGVSLGVPSVSQSVGTTGHFVRLHLRPQCPGRGHTRRILWENGAPGRIRTCDPRLRRPMRYPTELRTSWMTIGRARTFSRFIRTFSRFIRMAQQRSRCSLRPAWSSARHTTGRTCASAATLRARCRSHTTDAYIAWGECMDTDDSCVTVRPTEGTSQIGVFRTFTIGADI